MHDPSRLNLEALLRRWLLPPNVQYLLSTLSGQERRTHYMRFFRDIVAWTVPSEVQAVLLSGAHALLGNNVADNGRLEGRWADAERCFVIGNGPSLKEMDLSVLAGERVITTNSFYKHPQAQVVDPDVLCIGDASFMEDREESVSWHRRIAEELPRVKLMLNPAARPLIAKHGLYRDHEVFYYRHGVTTQYPELARFDFRKPLNVGHTTGTRLAIPLAVYLGCKKIYLLGFDANWLESFTASYHFYETHEQFPEFDSLAADQRWPHYEDHLVFAQRDFASHHLIASRCPDLGVEVLNAGVGGLLDMYPRVDFKSLFRE